MIGGHGHGRDVRRRRHRGFTLIELVVTIAIAAILMMVAAPSFVTFRKNSQLTAAANTFLAAATAARAEAMKRQLNAFVRPTDATNWANGWTVYVDGDWDGLSTSSVDILINAQDPLPTNVTTSPDNTPTDSNSHYVMFSGAGYLWNVTTGAPQILSSLTFTNGTESRLILMSASGRMRVCNPATDTTCTNSGF